MGEYADFATFAFVILLSIVDPVGNIPLFLVITHQDSENERRRIVIKACSASFCILTFFLFAGNVILDLFHLSLGAFRIAGGIVLFIISLQMLFHLNPGQKTSPQEEREAVEKDDVSIFPLAIPLLSGPGALAAVIMLRSEAHTAVHVFVLFGVIAVTVLITFCILTASQHMMRILGHPLLQQPLQRVCGDADGTSAWPQYRGVRARRRPGGIPCTAAHLLRSTDQ